MEGAEPLPRRSLSVLPKLATALPLITKGAQHPKNDLKEAVMAEKAYNLNLKFDCWSSQCWFLGEDSPEAEARFKAAREKIPGVAEYCRNPLQFSARVAELFKSFGFDRVHK